MQARNLPRPTSIVVPSLLTRSRSGDRELQCALQAEWCMARDRPSPYEHSSAWLTGRRALQARNLPRPTSRVVPGILTCSRSGERELQRALRASWCMARDRPSPYEHRGAWLPGRRALQARNLPRPTSRVVPGILTRSRLGDLELQARPTNIGVPGEGQALALRADR